MKQPNKNDDNAPQKIDAVLKEIFTQKSLKKGWTEVQVVSAWYEAMGEHIRQYTREIKFNKGTLYVGMDSAPLKMELNYGKEKIVRLVNSQLEIPLVEKIIFH